jgi:hypothetical protein
LLDGVHAAVRAHSDGDPRRGAPPAGREGLRGDEDPGGGGGGGSKEGLFAAADDIDLRLTEATIDCPPEQLGERLARHVIARWEGPLADELITLLLRSASTHPVAAAHMRAIFETQVVRVVRDALGDTPDTPRRVGMISTQVLGMALCRYILRLPPVVEMDADTLAATMAPVLQHYLTGDLDRAVGSPAGGAATA